jgi:hypothetical protein
MMTTRWWCVPPLLSGLGYEPGLVAEIGRFLWAISWGHRGFESRFLPRGAILCGSISRPRGGKPRYSSQYERERRGSSG